MGKAYRIPSATDRLRRQQIQIKNLQAQFRNRNTPRPVASTAFAGASAAGSTGGTGNFLRTEGDTMTGPFALAPPVDFSVDIDSDGIIDIGESSSNSQYSSNVQFEDIQPNTFVLDTIAGAAFDGQVLILRTFAPSTPITIAQATLANGGNIQTLTDADFDMGDLQMIWLVFDADLIVFDNAPGGTWRVMSPPSGSGDVSQWATFPAVADIDYATFDGINIDRLRFVVDSGVPASSSDPSIFLGSDAFMNFNAATEDGFRWKANDVEMARLSEVAAGVYRFDMLDHSIVNAQDVRLDDTSGAIVFPSTSPAIGFDSAASRFILNMPTGANLFVTNNGNIGTLQMNNNSITANIVNANDVLQLGVDATAPTVVGEFRNDGTDVLVFSGGAVRNLSDGGGANIQLSNLGVTAINADLLFDASTHNIGDATNRVDNLNVQTVRLRAGGGVANVPSIHTSTGSILDLNFPLGSQMELSENGATKYTWTASSFTAPNIILTGASLSSNLAGISFDFSASGWIIKVASGDTIKNEIDGGDEFTISETVLDAHTKKIQNVVDATADQDAVTLSQLNSKTAGGLRTPLNSPLSPVVIEPINWTREITAVVTQV